MALLGLILLLLGVGAAAFALWVATAGQSVVAADGSSALSVPVFGGNAFQLQTMTLVLLGVGGVILALLGVWMMISAGKRSARRSRERRELRKSQKQQEKELAETRSRLAAAEGRPVEPAREPRADPLEVGTAEQRVVHDEATYTTDEHGRPTDDHRDGTLR